MSRWSRDPEFPGTTPPKAAGKPQPTPGARTRALQSTDHVPINHPRSPSVSSPAGSAKGEGVRNLPIGQPRRLPSPSVPLRGPRLQGNAMRADPATRQRQPRRAGLPAPVKSARIQTREARGRGGGTSADVGWGWRRILEGVGEARGGVIRRPGAPGSTRSVPYARLAKHLDQAKPFDHIARAGARQVTSILIQDHIALAGPARLGIAQHR